MTVGKFLRVVGNSMAPTIREDTYILVSGIPYIFQNPRVHDIVVAYVAKSQRIIVKRIHKIENDMYFLLGDNKEESTDSRKYGYIERKYIIGKVLWWF